MLSSDKRIIRILVSIFTVMLVLCSITGCQSKSSSIILDYGDEIAFENALNAGENLEGKTVSFTALELRPNSEYGYNVWAGEHLNFVSERNPEIKAGDVVTVRATTIRSISGSWIIDYEKEPNAVAGDSTIYAASGTGGNKSIEGVSILDNENEPDWTAKHTVSGLDEATNDHYTTGGIQFAFPSYYDAYKSDEEYFDVMFYPEAKEYSASLAFKEGEIQEKTDSKTLLKKNSDDLIETYKENDWKMLNSSEIVCAGYPGWEGTFEVDGSQMKSALVHNTEENLLLYIMVVFDDIDQSDRDYLGDFEKMLSNAQAYHEGILTDEQTEEHNINDKLSIKIPKLYIVEDNDGVFTAVRSDGDAVLLAYATDTYGKTTDDTILDALLDVCIESLNAKATSDSYSENILGIEYKSKNFTTTFESRPYSGKAYVRTEPIQGQIVISLMLLYDNSEHKELYEKTLAQSIASISPIGTATDSRSDRENKGTSISGIRPDFKEALDSYEAFFDEYVEIMNAYAKNPTDLSLLSKYSEYLSKYADMEKKLEGLKAEDMSLEESAYLIDVTARIEKKLLTIGQ